MKSQGRLRNMKITWYGQWTKGINIWSRKTNQEAAPVVEPTRGKNTPIRARWERIGAGMEHGHPGVFVYCAQREKSETDQVGETSKAVMYVQSLKRNPGIETCQSLNSIWSHGNRPHQTKEYSEARPKQLWHLEDRKKRRGNRSNRHSNRCDSKQNDKYFKENGTTEYDDAEKQRTKILHTGLAPCRRHFDKQKSEKGLKWRK